MTDFSTLFGITIYVVPDDDERMKDIPQGHYGLGMSRCLVRESDWPSFKAALEARFK